MMTIKDSEQIRQTLGLGMYEFSQKLGYSYSTYYNAVRRQRLSRGLALALSVRFGRKWKEIRSAA